MIILTLARICHLLPGSPDQFVLTYQDPAQALPHPERLLHPPTSSPSGLWARSLVLFLFSSQCIIFVNLFVSHTSQTGRVYLVSPLILQSLNAWEIPLREESDWLLSMGSQESDTT